MGNHFGKAMTEITSEDVRKLIEQEHTREDIHLEYKLDGSSDGILSDICAFANSQGGYILIGVKEDKSKGEGYPESIPGITNSDNLEIELREKIKDNISPSILGWASRKLTVNGKTILIIQIPNSQNKPHFYKQKGYQPFPFRQTRSTKFLTMDDVKNQILVRSDSNNRINTELEKILNLNLNEQFLKPVMTLIAIPTYFGQDFIDVSNDNIKQFIRALPHNPNVFNRNCLEVNGTVRYCLEGIEKVEYRPSGESIGYRYLRIYRNGTLEYSQTGISMKKDQQLYLISEMIALAIMDFEYYYKCLMELTSTYDPTTFCINFKNTLGTKIYKGQMPIEDINTSPSTWQRNILDYRISFPSLVEGNIAQILIERFFNAFGYEK